MPTPLRRWLAGVLAALIGLGPLMSPAYGAATPLGDEPLNTRNSAKPNIVLTVDDSTSMLNDFLPDYVISNYCRGGLGAMTAACGNNGAASDFSAVGGGKYFSPGYIYQQYGYPYTQNGSGAFTPAYDASGPGAGCYPGSPPTCSAGVNPGTAPGLSVYPAGPQPSWPNAGKPYEYWLLWPAPAHSTSLNAIYYDPRLTYDPPVDATGASYDQMDAGHTTSWTQVPADPWATTITYVDLVTPPGNPKTLGWINIGQWCNTDWSLGSPTDPKVCRVNGSGAAAFGTVTAAQGADYTYPWAPPSFVLSASPGAVVTNTYAAQKVTLTTDPAYTNGGKLYGTGFGTAVTAAWANAQDAKYFYENENVIWCDPTSPSWPQTGPTQSQFCGSLLNQTCGGQTQTCDKDPGNCSGNPTAATCNGLVIGACTGAGCNGTPGTCNNFVPAACNAASCTSKKPQTCNGIQQTCATSPQTCSGPTNQTCQLPGTQTCQPPVCSITYSPAGCNLLPSDPENPCTPVTTCAPPVCTDNPGACSITKTSCGGGSPPMTQAQADAQCLPVAGSCSFTGKSCTQQSDCQPAGSCSIDKSVCTIQSDCGIIGGTCSKKGNACTKNTDCPDVGVCSSNANTVCLFDTECGVCNNPANKSCATASDCSDKLGTCSQRVCVGGNNAGTPCPQNACTGGGSCAAAASCSDASACPVSGGKCATGNAACTLNTQCPGKCDNNSGALKNKACSGATQADANLQCLTPGKCNLNAAQSCTAACTDIQFNGTTDTSCGCPVAFGTCKGTKIVPPPACFATSCNQGQTQFCCSNIKTCSNTHSSCNSAVECPDVNLICSITSLPCSFPGVDIVNCPHVGKCSATGAQCTSNANCPDQPGPLPPSAAVCTTGGVAGVSTATLRNDAENNGVVCRRNNKASGTYTSGAYAYPSGKFLTPITGPFAPDANASSPDACPATAHFASAPRHYWKSEVQWCDQKVANTPTTSDQWAGFGTDVGGGTCQPAKDATHFYPRFYQFGKTSYVDNKTTAAF